MTPRNYQLAARDAVLAEYRRGIKNTLVLMATGSGKTVVFALIADAMRRMLMAQNRPNKVLVLAHREELLTQAAEKFSTWAPTLSVDIEQGDRKVTRHALPDVTIASVQSLSQPKRLAEFDHAQFGLFIVDESHRGVANSYRTIYQAFPQCYGLFVTATPDRTDKVALGNICQSVAFVFDLRTAIEEQWLAPIYREEIVIEDVDFSRLASSRAVDFSDQELEQEFAREGAVLQVADAIVRISQDKGQDRPTIAFCPGVRHSELLAQAINSLRPASAACITAKTENRGQLLRRYTAGEIRYLTNYNIATEGVDLPATSMIAMCRPTKSRLVYAQAAGRGTRLYEGKKDCLIVDFTDASRRHDLISAIDIFDGGTIDPKIKERAEQIAKKRGIDALTALKESTEEIGREEQLALAKQIAGQTRFSRLQLDAFTVIGVVPRPGRYLGQQPTSDQLRRLDRHKVPWEGLDRGQAQQVIEAIDKRMSAGMCSPRQAKILIRYGFDPNIQLEIAAAQIDYIAKRNWQLTPQDREQIRRIGAGSLAA